MTGPILNRSQAVKVVKKYLLKEAGNLAEHCLITDMAASIRTIYRAWPRNTPVWYVRCPDNGPPFMVGPSRVIVISKKTGMSCSMGIPGNRMGREIVFYQA